jgi:predicted RNA methylase
MNNAKRVDYVSLERKEMLRFIAADAGLVLEVGCRDGMFGLAVKRPCGSEVWGIERDNETGSAARAKLDKVII